MKKKITDSQNKIRPITSEGVSGGDKVKITLNGDGEIVSINIEAQILADQVNDTSSTISGTNTGEISFSVEASTNAKLSYQIKNNDEPLNYRFTGKDETVTAGDYFEISVLPS